MGIVAYKGYVFFKAMSRKIDYLYDIQNRIGDKEILRKTINEVEATGKKLSESQRAYLQVLNEKPLREMVLLLAIKVEVHNDKKGDK